MIEPMSKLALLGVAASAAVMAAGPEEEHAAGHEGDTLRRVNMVQGYSAVAAKPPVAGEALKFERMLRQKQRADEGRHVGNAFNATSWYVPPPPPPALPPPPPSAPPLPFTYLGQYKDADTGAAVIFLSNADRVYTVSEGDVIDGTYSVGPIRSGQLEVTYIPLNIKQSLSIGGVS